MNAPLILPRTRVLLFATAVCAALLLQFAWATVASAGLLGTTTLTVNAVGPLQYGASAQLSGMLSLEGTGPAGAIIVLTSSKDASSWAPAAAVCVAADGSFGYRTASLTESTYFRAEYAGSEFSAPASLTVGVRVRARIGAPRVPVSVTKAYPFVASGSLEPPHEAAVVTLYCDRYEAGKWVRRRSFAATVKGSTYSTTVNFPFSGTWRIMATHSDAGHASSWARASQPVGVRTATDAIVWNRDGVLTIPERMFQRSNARQMIVATGAKIGAKYGTLRFFEYRNGDWVQLMSAPCRFGRNGLTNGLTRRTGTLTTPTGIWLMPSYVFGQHAAAPSGTRMPYRRITARSYWSAANNATYNTWVESAKPVYGEHLIDYTTAYEWALSTGYNSLPNQRVYGRGTAIFLHCFRGTALTAGCISVSSADMVRIFRLLTPAQRRLFAVGTTQVGTTTSIYAY